MLILFLEGNDHTQEVIGCRYCYRLGIILNIVSQELVHNNKKSVWWKDWGQLFWVPLWQLKVSSMIIIWIYYRNEALNKNTVAKVRKKTNTSF